MYPDQSAVWSGSTMFAHARMFKNLGSLRHKGIQPCSWRFGGHETYLEKCCTSMKTHFFLSALECTRIFRCSPSTLNNCGHKCFAPYNFSASHCRVSKNSLLKSNLENLKGFIRAYCSLLTSMKDLIKPSFSSSLS